MVLGLTRQLVCVLFFQVEHVNQDAVLVSSPTAAAACPHRQARAMRRQRPARCRVNSHVHALACIDTDAHRTDTTHPKARTHTKNGPHSSHRWHVHARIHAQLQAYLHQFMYARCGTPSTRATIWQICFAHMPHHLAMQAAPTRPPWGSNPRPQGIHGGGRATSTENA